ncbi:hypothetical protein MKL42_03035 [Acinetobacter sp. AOR15_HL]|nr:MULTISPECIES: hypothetical protein [unclassified Acinetobacter]MDA3556497.1 hypothetical protein [Acinetobacter sp. AOR15_HL]MDA3573512.1 hypothetical protein [Acinetobacter sp. AOR14_HL]
MFGYEPRVFGENSSTDGYDELGISLDYDSADKVIALVFYEPAQVIFNGTEISKLTASEAYKLMATLDKDIIIDGDSLTSFKFGIGFYEPNYEEEPFLPVEAIIIFIEGYYD